MNATHAVSRIAATSPRPGGQIALALTEALCALLAFRELCMVLSVLGTEYLELSGGAQACTGIPHRDRVAPAKRSLPIIGRMGSCSWALQRSCDG